MKIKPLFKQYPSYSKESSTDAWDFVIWLFWAVMGWVRLRCTPTVKHMWSISSCGYKVKWHNNIQIFKKKMFTLVIESVCFYPCQDFRLLQNNCDLQGFICKWWVYVRTSICFIKIFILLIVYTSATWPHSFCTILNHQNNLLCCNTN